jgi:hypothetical protein
MHAAVMRATRFATTRRYRPEDLAHPADLPELEALFTLRVAASGRHQGPCLADTTAGHAHASPIPPTPSPAVSPEAAHAFEWFALRSDKHWWVPLDNNGAAVGEASAEGTAVGGDGTPGALDFVATLRRTCDEYDAMCAAEHNATSVGSGRGIADGPRAVAGRSGGAAVGEAHLCTVCCRVFRSRKGLAAHLHIQHGVAPDT